MIRDIARRDESLNPRSSLCTANFSHSWTSTCTPNIHRRHRTAHSTEPRAIAKEPHTNAQYTEWNAWRSQQAITHTSHRTRSALARVESTHLTLCEVYAGTDVGCSDVLVHSSKASSPCCRVLRLQVHPRENVKSCCPATTGLRRRHTLPTSNDALGRSRSHVRPHAARAGLAMHAPP